MTIEATIEGDKRMPTWAHHWSAGSRTERQQRGLQRVLMMFWTIFKRTTRHSTHLQPTPCSRAHLEATNNARI